jgi:hypothetical protein
VQLVTADGFTGFGQGETHLDQILERLALYEFLAAPRRLVLPPGTEQVVRIPLDARRDSGPKDQ